ncbi:hypothetical protein HS088_TW06G01430 [Tripterygium wilfordii]|uniref:Uncharacterized protein n=1 Tax=Tripterygium wilfordii TaxID=458696 RepID=A0A7J7DLV0_TRIWF|nr:hypothetical protein HS088_TW06G01430 [Tripterygium wilfordii]
MDEKKEHSQGESKRRKMEELMDEKKEQSHGENKRRKMERSLSENSSKDGETEVMASIDRKRSCSFTSRFEYIALGTNSALTAEDSLFKELKTLSSVCHFSTPNKHVNMVQCL